MSLYLCDMADRCSHSKCRHRTPHKGLLNFRGDNMCIVPILCFSGQVRCVICDDKEEEEVVYFIKKDKHDSFSM
jgi:hypothetical protein